jgi:hypothetical protein
MPRPLRAVVKIAGRIGASQQWHHQRIPWPRGTLQAGAFDGSVRSSNQRMSLCGPRLPRSARPTWVRLLGKIRRAYGRQGDAFRIMP